MFSNQIDPLFTDTNIHSYFSKYGKIIDLKILEEENTAGICFITFDDVDSSDRVLLDMPHYLNGQLLSIHKYTEPEYICNLSQYRFIDEKTANQTKRWYPIFRNLTDFVEPLRILHKTQLALVQYNMNKQIQTNNQNFNKQKEYLHEYENENNNIKQNCIQLSNLNDELRKKIGEIIEKNEKLRSQYESQIDEQKKKNQSLEYSNTSLNEGF